METRKRACWTAVAALVALFGSALPVPAQFTTSSATAAKSGSTGLSIGNSWLGGSLSAGGSFTASNNSTSNTAFGSAYLSAYGKLLGMSGQIASLSAYGSANSGNSNSASYRLTVAGTTIVNTVVSSGAKTHLFRPARQLLNLFGSTASAGIPVGPVTVHVSGNVGTDVNSALNVTVGSGAIVQLKGTTTASALASGSASVKVLGFGASMQLYGQILQTTITAVATADARGVPSISGVIPLSVYPISLFLKVCAIAPWGKWCKTLTSWSAAAIQIPDLLAL